MPRLHCPLALARAAHLALPAGAARHVQVLRMQPGQALRLFNGEGGEWDAEIERIGRSEVWVRVGAHHAIEREAAPAVHLAVALMTGERMDALIEKATELGAASIQPLLAERSVLRLAGERAARRQAHWQAVAVAACEQCGRNRVPPVQAPRELADWLSHGLDATDGAAPTRRWLLSLRDGAQPLPRNGAGAGTVLLLSGPEGGWSASEENAALARGFVATSLGPRTLRADTAPLAALAALTLPP